MRNSKNKARCERRKIGKCDEVARLYSDLQSKYADMLQTDDAVQSFVCNYPLDTCSMGSTYTTDFFVTLENGDLRVRECVYRQYLTKPLTVKMLSASYNYWLRHGVTDWGLVVDEEE